MSGLVFRSASELARMIRDRRCSAVEVLKAHLDQMEKHNPRLNAVVTIDAGSAMVRAQEADAALSRGEVWGPLHGVPMTIKDGFETAGMRTTFGLSFLMNHVPEQDATAVARLRRAGAVIFGKTNVPFACYDWQCKHPKFGRTNNPWDPNRTPGGSSGGPAAALASGITPLELGSDVAGSIRVPCHFCGVAGIRTTEGGVSGAGATRAPGYPRALRNLFAAGPMARTVKDLRLGLSIVWGPDRRDWVVPPVDLDRDDRPAELCGLRVAWCTELGGVPVSTEVKVVIDGLVSKLADAGCVVEEAVPSDFDFPSALEAWGNIQGFESAALLPFPLRVPPLRWFPRFGILRAMFGKGGFSRALSRGMTAGGRGYIEALTRRDELVHAMDRFLEAWDVWISPVASTTAFTHRRTGKPIDVDGRPVSYSQAMGMYNCPSALAANPIVVLPAGQTPSGLPVGVQIHGRRWSDARLLAIAERIEEVAGPVRPPIHLPAAVLP